MDTVKRFPVGIHEKEHDMLKKIKKYDGLPSLRYTLDIIIREAFKKRKLDISKKED